MASMLLVLENSVRFLGVFYAFDNLIFVDSTRHLVDS